MIEQYLPWIDYKDLTKQISDYLKTEKGWLTEFKKTEELEKEICKFLDVKYATVVSNGTIAISLALLANGIKKNDRVLVPDLTMIATAYAVELIGAVPVFCDIEPETLCLDLSKARQIIEINENTENRIKAVIHVSFNGRKNHFLTYNGFETFCNLSGVKLIEDNAQSFGSMQTPNKISCPNKNIGTFSFSMPKIITTGQGGCLVTNDEQLSNRIKKLKDFGRLKGGVDIHTEYGINCKFTELQAITGLSQFKNLKERIEIKKEIFKKYKERLLTVKGIHFLANDSQTVPWFVDVYAEDRNGLMEYLVSQGIKTRPMYPALHTQTQYQQEHHSWLDKDFTEANRMSAMGLWLPSSMTITDKEIDKVCESIKKFYFSKELDKSQITG